MLFQKQETHRTMAHSFAPIQSKNIYNKHTYMRVYVYVYISFCVCMRAHRLQSVKTNLKRRRIE